MTKIAVLNGQITIHHVKRLYSHGKYERRLFLSVQNDREFADMRLSRENAEELICKLQEALKMNL